MRFSICVGISRRCTTVPKSFCYVCSELIFKKQRRISQNFLWNVIPYISVSHFGISSRYIMGPSYLLHNMCEEFNWLEERTEPRAHVSGCYFCLTDRNSIHFKRKHKIIYTNLPSAIRPVSHSETLPILIAPTFDEMHITSISNLEVF